MGQQAGRAIFLSVFRKGKIPAAFQMIERAKAKKAIDIGSPVARIILAAVIPEIFIAHGSPGKITVPW
jgi:hypothetical protein